MKVYDSVEYKKSDMRVCIVPGILPQKLPDADTIHITKLTKIIQKCVSEVTVCGVNTSTLVSNLSDVRVVNIPYSEPSTSTFMRIFYFILNQIKISKYLFKNRRSIDTVFLAIGSGCFIIPTIIAKAFQKKVMIIYSGKDSIKIYSQDYYRCIKVNFASKVLPEIAKYLEILNCMLTDMVITNSEDIDPLLERQCRNKITYIRLGHNSPKVLY